MRQTLVKPLPQWSATLRIRQIDISSHSQAGSSSWSATSETSQFRRMVSKKSRAKSVPGGAEAGGGRFSKARRIVAVGLSWSSRRRTAASGSDEAVG
eukprot:CAMPEP_0181211996 /NCGR_PEP_ID=MMETSP1096-20121128/24101_1 /TAXON_ID=156174 ORGANISM="Chrysochromulina ericina, Strain CCMP281" /NCGR_SAMPLE_ID=MMETSP1096 /ASSEMBLY_ACC=CAM_ASM_000453 /LENGTH=96 /DNA_ID=CAMNT_0023303469 /DNA_START=218 /DNA_END=508 /DNA_ORIENTATION=+